jgi:hypothetical protein
LTTGGAAALGARALGAGVVRETVGETARETVRETARETVREMVRGEAVDGDWGFDFFKGTSDRPVFADKLRRQTRDRAGNPVCGLQDGVERSPRRGDLHHYRTIRSD